MSPNQVLMQHATLTDVGRRRSHNEDSVSVWMPEESGPHPADLMIVVADGMGGSNAGEVASSMTVEAVVSAFATDSSGDPVQSLRGALEAANEYVWEHSRSHADLQGMGTTCTAMALRDGEATLAHVGDSRAYLVRDGQAHPLTNDHSLVAQLVARSQLTPEQARTDPRRNVVTRSVGVGPVVEVDIIQLVEPLRSGDAILICSDGLHGQVTDEEIGSIASQESLETACRDLIDLANERGGPDNITVAIARLVLPGSEPVAATEPVASAAEARAGVLRSGAILVTVALLAVLGLLAWWWTHGAH